MVSFFNLAAIIFAVGHAVLAVAIPRPEPIIFYNLTREEFLLKRAEHTLTKRAFVELETLNLRYHMDGQRLIEFLSLACITKFDDPRLRASRGSCSSSVKMDVYCSVPPGPVSVGVRHMVGDCRPGVEECVTLQAHNYRGAIRNFPYCQKVLPINKPPVAKVDASPRYEGSMELTLPPPPTDWGPVHPDLPSPGTIDAHFDMAGQYLKAAWEYRGHWSNGWGFLLTSVGLATSFSCLGCPSGTLYAETVGFKSRAVGFVLPHML